MPRSRLSIARVRENRRLCREHYRLTMHSVGFGSARPGQFVHLCPEPRVDEGYHVWEGEESDSREAARDWRASPMLRRAYSVAGLRVVGGGSEIDVIYRVVGRGTRWLESLAEGDELSLLGPLGNEFPISRSKRMVWMIAGGVGLPPMLYLAEALKLAGKEAIAFCGAQSRDLLALTFEPGTDPSVTASTATLCVSEFSRHGLGAVISTDDGTWGFHGHIGAALSAYAAAHPPVEDDLVVYTCGPERMMRFVAEFCVQRSIECHVCMERAMACGTGMCQSCVVPVYDDTDSAGWRYRLCCTEGPVFNASEIIWDPVGTVVRS